MKGSVEAGDLGNIGITFERPFENSDLAGQVQRGEGHESAEFGDQGVIDDRGGESIRPAVNEPMTDRDRPRPAKRSIDFATASAAARWSEHSQGSSREDPVDPSFTRKRPSFKPIRSNRTLRRHFLKSLADSIQGELKRRRAGIQTENRTSDGHRMVLEMKGFKMRGFKIQESLKPGPRIQE